MTRPAGQGQGKAAVRKGVTTRVVLGMRTFSKARYLGRQVAVKGLASALSHLAVAVVKQGVGGGVTRARPRMLVKTGQLPGNDSVRVSL
jgi:hypothetical protein